ncbi:NUDIX domain-containing protein [bacterium]|nr:MAG: NUDIX domain-containing protein [bacterium]
MTNQPNWLDWAQKLTALAQSGLAFSHNPFEIDRYKQIRAIAAEMIAENGNLPPRDVKHTLELERGYATPKLDVRGVVFKDDKILMVKELADGGWTLPGGFIDVGEPPSRAVEREVWEESGYLVKATKLLAVFDRNQHGHPPYIFHLYKLFIRCELLGGQPTDSVETAGADFFPENEHPPLSIARFTGEELHRMFVHLRQPDPPTDFD